MDWIEEVFHISPDGGNGSFEILCGAAIALATAALARSLWLRRGARGKPADAVASGSERSTRDSTR